MEFREYLETQDKKIISLTQQARQQGGICSRARFGDCNDIVARTLALLTHNGIRAKKVAGYFYCSFENDEFYDHTWIAVGDSILDPTVDQFYSPLDVDLVTKTRGIYYSSPDWDGDWLEKRYKFWA